MKRSRIEICMAILKACKKEISITYLMYATHTNVPVLLNTAMMLEQRGFLRISQKAYKTKRAVHNGKNSPKYALSANPHLRLRREFLTTEKGLAVLGLYEQFMRLWHEDSWTLEPLIMTTVEG